MTDFSLPESFFKEHKLASLQTTGHLSYFQMRSLFDSDLHERIHDVVLPSFSSQREKDFLRERGEIENISTPEELVRYMRKPIETANRDDLCQKGVGMGGAVADLIIDKLARNGIDTFIESAMLILSRADEIYIDRVAKEFLNFRNKYAQTQATVLLAYRERIDVLEKIYILFGNFAFSSDREDRRLSETVLFSIYLMTGHAEDFKTDVDGLIGRMGN